MRPKKVIIIEPDRERKSYYLIGLGLMFENKVTSFLANDGEEAVTWMEDEKVIPDAAYLSTAYPDWIAILKSLILNGVDPQKIRVISHFGINELDNPYVSRDRWVTRQQGAQFLTIHQVISQGTGFFDI